MDCVAFSMQLPLRIVSGASNGDVMVWKLVEDVPLNTDADATDKDNKSSGGEAAYDVSLTSTSNEQNSLKDGKSAGTVWWDD